MKSKKLFLFLLASTMLTSSVTTMAKSSTDVTVNSQKNIQEIKLDIPLKITYNKPTSEIMPLDLDLKSHSHRLEDIVKSTDSRYQYKSDWYSGPANVTLTKGTETTIGGSISGSVGMSSDVIEGELSIDASGSKTYTVSISYEREVPAGYRGAFAFKYSRYKYTFTCVKDYKDSKYTDEYGSGYAYTVPHDGYYTMLFQRL